MRRRRPHFATFYTNDAYLEDARRLERCCRHFGISLTIIAGRELGGWKRNCNQKPRLLEAFRNRVDGPIVWLDADCIIHHEPTVLLMDHPEDAVLWQGGRSHKPYVSSQVTWWNDTGMAREMIADWARRSRDDPESKSDPLLKQACEHARGRASIGVLPDPYLRVYWKPPVEVPAEDIVISSNERRSIHADAKPRQNRVRQVPLNLPFEECA